MSIRVMLAVLATVHIAGCGGGTGTNDSPADNLDASIDEVPGDTAEGTAPFPSNVGDVGFDAGSAALVVKNGDEVILRAYDGGVMLIPSVGSVSMIRPVGVSGLDQPSGIYYTLLDSPVPGAPKLGVFVVQSLHVEAGARLAGASSPDTALVILVGTTARIDGVLDVSSFGGTGGPGGGAGGAPYDEADFSHAGGGAGGGGAAPKIINGNTRYAGGAGGGFGSYGGGGGPTIDSAAGSTGVVYGNAVLVPLVGGSGGGAGDGAKASFGGGGGGAVQLSARDRITITGRVEAGGGGGGGGRYVPFTVGFGGGGSGGGSGGAILLESTTIELAPTSLVAANGGGGGAGTPNCDSNACVSSGTVGSALMVPAPGGMLPLHADSSRGGDGSSQNGGDGQTPAQAPGDDGGGGGGGAGRIRINTRSDADTIVLGTITPTLGSQLATIGRIGTAP